ncbi:hypothetical protein KO527_22250 [Pseudoalteromonas sp. C2R02]|uniref:hypothetical protein n=1 Tax=Pseudoalteromonas sp. C2R02 TaxID=2841565 RepID=UPI001C091EF2|nr:hypothetical protein [Pseudoalteromonas sp. C2R02]MBU2972063.1 hypothetical protein [Pseudoalteromonas sp. C2R02]
MSYNSETLKILNETWQAFKLSTKTNQAKAAKAMGMNQSAFSQYLRGDIPLNTDFVAKFSTMTGSQIESYLTKTAKNQLHLQPIAIKYTLSGRKLLDSFELMPSPVNLDHAYAILVDYCDFIFQRGTLLLVDTEAEIREHDAVVVINKNNRPIYGVLSFKENEWEILEPHYFGGNRFVIRKNMVVHRVSGSYSPETQGKIFKKEHS